MYGVAIPTIPGVRCVLDEILLLDMQKGGNREAPIVWTNLREEPVVYVNNRPFVLRNMKKPYANLEHTGKIHPSAFAMEDAFSHEHPGIDAVRLELQEESLKKDILAEAARSNGTLSSFAYFDVLIDLTANITIVN